MTSAFYHKNIILHLYQKCREHTLADVVGFFVAPSDDEAKVAQVSHGDAVAIVAIGYEDRAHDVARSETHRFGQRMTREELTSQVSEPDTFVVRLYAAGARSPRRPSLRFLPIGSGPPTRLR